MATKQKKNQEDSFKLYNNQIFRKYCSGEILKLSKRDTLYRKEKNRMELDFSSEILQVRYHWRNTDKSLKGKKINPRNINIENIIIK